MQTVDVKPEMIRWAIDRSGLPEEMLLEKFPKLDKWQSGQKRPTLRQLEEFAKKTMTPFGVMFLDEPPEEELPVPDFRTMKDASIRRPSPNLIETIQSIQQRQDWIRDWLIEEGSQPLEFVGSVGEVRNVESLAQKIRKSLDLDAEWAESLRTWED
ncbi:MAG TPA: hypothetical protein VLA12_05955, partial [Planctomycetaceae bacterium]|nr:hypothetical protein [Planctomycetaceae bacterium]